MPAAIAHLIGPDTRPQRLRVLQRLLEAAPQIGPQHVVNVGRPLPDCPIEPAARLPGRPAAWHLLRPPAAVTAALRAPVWHIWTPAGLAVWRRLSWRLETPQRCWVDVDLSAAPRRLLDEVPEDRRVGFVAHSERAIQRMASAGIPPQRRILIAEPAVQTSRDPTVRSAARAHLDLDKADTVALIIPPAAAPADPMTGVWATMIVQIIIERMRVIVPGHGPDITRLMRLVDATDHRFMVRHVAEPSDPAELHAAADVGVYATTRDASIDGLVEAQAAGLPLVASDVPAVRELVSDQETGLLVQPGRPDLLARCLLAVLETPQRMAELACAAQQKAEHADRGSALVSAYAGLYARRQDVVLAAT